MRIKDRRLTCLSLILLINGFGVLSLFSVSKVKIWEETVIMPTYPVEKKDVNPRFYEGRVYQGAQGRAYPYPMNENLPNKKSDLPHTMIYLENEYVKINLLPEIGGRLFGALDKTNNYEFVFRQSTIKPALIGMVGAWLSGGIEWNFPHHHRVNAYMPVDYIMEENKDGSATVWIAEIEMRHRMKFLMGVSLYPGKSLVEIRFKPANRTPFAHSFLYFANVGVHTNKDYQVVFPPSTEFGVHHAKREFIRWPVADRRYGGVDHAGNDVSWWKNHPKWTSIFAFNYEDDFLGGYDHGKEAGTILVSNHHIAPGKKFWTWSAGPKGVLWDKWITEGDGPVLELMIGGYSDNQPDYSWMQPYESKFLKQYMYPARKLGGIKNANREAAVNLEIDDEGQVKLAFNATSVQKNAKILLKYREDILFETNIDIDPANPFEKELKLKKSVNRHELTAMLLSSDGKELVSYSPVIKKNDNPYPESVKPPRDPQDYNSVEELYLAGMRLEQFYHPSLEPYPYYEEALKRDPGNSDVNTALGLLYLRRGMYETAEKHLKIAVDRVSNNYTKPRDGEALYYLGLALRYMGKTKEAYDAFYRATWSLAFHSAAYMQLAEMDCAREKFDLALEHLNRSLSTNQNNLKARNLKAVVLRKLGKGDDACAIVTRALKDDPLNYWAANEGILLNNRESGKDGRSKLSGQKKRTPGDDVQAHLELATDYGNSGFFEEAIDVLSRLDKTKHADGCKFPMLYYYLGYYLSRKGEESEALRYYRIADKMPADFCFPYRLESIVVLDHAIAMNPKGAKAPYYLGNLLFEKQPERAISLWEKSRDLNDSLAIVHRNLGMAYYKIQKDAEKSIAAYEDGIRWNNQDQRLFYELDRIYEEGQVSPEKRLKLLRDNHKTLVNSHVCDGLVREVHLLTQLGYYDESLDKLIHHFYRQWEGIHKAYKTYVDAHLLRGRQYFDSGDYDKALKDYQAVLEFPDNLMYNKPYSDGRVVEGYYHVGTVYEAQGNQEEADSYYKMAVDHRMSNWKQSPGWFCRGLSFRKLGEHEKADEIFKSLIADGEKRLESDKTDFFAKFGDQKSDKLKRADAHYQTGLGYLGLHNIDRAEKAFLTAVELNINHYWARARLEHLKHVK